MNSQKISIFSSFQSNRLTYVLDFIFGQFFKAEYTLHLNDNNNQPYHVFYSSEKDTSNTSIRVNDSGFLDSFSHEQSTNYLHHAQGNSFDLFSMIFYHLARVEEYGKSSNDKFERALAKDSFLHSAGLLNQPIIDKLLLKFAEAINSKFNIKLERKSNFELIHTVDVDQIFAYKYKSKIRSVGGFFRDLFRLNFKRCSDRLKAFTNAKDPYDTFDYLKESSKDFKSFYFFLMAHSGGPDNALDPSSEVVQSKIKSIDPTSIKGIHPGIESHASEQLLEKEIKQLESILNHEITHSRQHFLKLNFPDTYRKLLAAKIYEDHSMGYHDYFGFRVGTTESFFWYDLENETTSELLIHPLVVMDVTLKKYMNLSPAEAINQLGNLVNECKSVDGPLRMLWHNSSFYAEEGWDGWKEVYEEFLNFCR